MAYATLTGRFPIGDAALPAYVVLACPAGELSGKSNSRGEAPAAAPTME